ncbi:MAG: hypothetical protein HYY01_03835 [Chloroflexi bacterium]|nr:hypothetical protein [Chloroflexota bacterium]
MPTTGGYAGQLLRVDLSQRMTSNVVLDEHTVRQYLGGTGLGARILYHELNPATGWDHPDNRLILATGPLAGTRAKGSGTFSIVTKGAMTNGATSTQANGFMGAYLKFCGYDGLIIQGQAPHLTYLYIHDGGAELRDARHLAGKNTWELEDSIKAELGYSEHQMSVFGIGPAGEHLVRFAAVVGDRGHVAGHNGPGAVLGAKRLKAIAVARGKTPVAVHDTQALGQAAEAMVARVNQDPMWGNTYNLGTLWLMGAFAPTGFIPVKNYTTNALGLDEETLRRFGPQYLREYLKARPHPCWACSAHHCHLITIPEGKYQGYEGEEPEFEGYTSWGPLIGNTDPITATVLSNEVDRLGMDTNEAGWVVAMAMEMYDRGLLTRAQTDGLELVWGNTDAVLDLLKNIASRQGLGASLAEGAKRAAEQLGAQDMAIYTMKGATPRSHDHRAAWREQFDTCVSSTGTIEAETNVRVEALGLPPITDPFSAPQISSAVARSKGYFQVIDSLGICRMPNKEVPDLIVAMLNAATGWDFTWDEAMQVGRRTVNLLRAFDVRCGVAGPHVDRPSSRYGSAPTDGPARGKATGPAWEEMLANYYELMGWDRITGKPLPETLALLGLAPVARDLWP